MIFTEEQINTAFYDWIQLVIPAINVQRLEDNGPRPDLPYISYRIQGFNLTGPYETSRPDDTGTAIIKGNIEIPLYIQCHGSNSLSNLQLLQRSVYDTDIQQFFYTSICAGFAQVLAQVVEFETSVDEVFD